MITVLAVDDCHHLLYFDRSRRAHAPHPRSAMTCLTIKRQGRLSVTAMQTVRPQRDHRLDSVGRRRVFSDSLKQTLCSLDITMSKSFGAKRLIVSTDSFISLWQWQVHKNLTELLE